jgi:hypothetical protein
MHICVLCTISAVAWAHSSSLIMYVWKCRRLHHNTPRAAQTLLICRENNENRRRRLWERSRKRHFCKYMYNMHCIRLMGELKKQIASPDFKCLCAEITLPSKNLRELFHSEEVVNCYTVTLLLFLSIIWRRSLCSNNKNCFYSFGTFFN